MALQAALLRASFGLLAGRGDHWAATVYRRLFELHPAARQLFAQVAPAEQTHKLLMMFALIVERLDDPPALAAQIRRLGVRHSHRGVTPRHYALMGQALLEAFADCLGPAWTPELRDAWAEAYDWLAGEMAAARPSG